jgi:hypothetical protein
MVWLTTFIALVFGPCGVVKVVDVFHPSSMINLMGRSYSNRFCQNTPLWNMSLDIFKILKDLGIFMTKVFCNCFEHINFLVVMPIGGKGWYKLRV